MLLGALVLPFFRAPLVTADSINFQVTVVKTDFSGWADVRVEVWDGATLLAAENTNSDGDVFFCLREGGPYEFRAGDASTMASVSGIPDAVLVGVILMPTVVKVNQPPVAVNDSYSTNEDAPLTTGAPGVLANDTDPDNDPLTAVLVSGPSHGTLTLNADGSFTYTPNLNYNGIDSFTYKANDAELDSNVATVNITVNNVNRAPVLDAIGGKAVNEGQLLSFTISATDPDGDPLTYSASSLPSGATFNLATRTFSWTPSYTQAGSYPGVHFQVTDGILTDSEDITITVNNVTGPAITVTSPNGGENWVVGTNQTIIWTSSGVIGAVRIELSRDGGLTWASIIPATPNDESQAWFVTGPATTHARIKVASVSNPAIFDISNADFTITIPPTSTITSPAQGACLNSLTQITGTANDSASGVQKVEVSIKRNSDNQYWNGSSWVADQTWLLAQGTTSWSYSWTPDGDGSYTIQSRATDNSNNQEAPGAGNTFTYDTTPPDGGSGDADGAAPPPVPPAPPRGTTDVRGKVSAAGDFLESVTIPSEDGLCTLTIPEGTVGLTEELEPLTEIIILIMDEPPPPLEDAHVIGLVYDFQPSGATFEPPITLEYKYDPGDIPEGIAEEDLVLAYYDQKAGEWVNLEGTVDTERNTITVLISHFTAFTILGYEVVPEPAAFTAGSLVISPTEVAIGQTVNVSLSVANTGGIAGSYKVTLKINGVVEATKEVTVGAGDSETVTFTTSRDVAGSYSVDVNGLTGSFTVKEKAAPPPPPPPAPPEVNWPVVWGTIAAVVVVGLLIFFVIRKRAY